jgi:hypothetical protein
MSPVASRLQGSVSWCKRARFDFRLGAGGGIERRLVGIAAVCWPQKRMPDHPHRDAALINPQNQTHKIQLVNLLLAIALGPFDHEFRVSPNVEEVVLHVRSEKNSVGADIDGRSCAFADASVLMQKAVMQCKLKRIAHCRTALAVGG